MKNKFKNEAVFIILFGIVYAAYFAFGFYHLSDFITADEHFWVNTRIRTYWHSLADPEDWSKTCLSNKPGIPVALISGVSLLKYNNPLASIKSAEKNDGSYPNKLKGVQTVQKIYAAFRIPIFVFNGAFSLFFFWIVNKLTGNRWVAFWSFTLIILSPILLGISQIINPDSLFWVFAAAAVLSFLAYLKLEEKKFILLSPVFLGFSLLSKFVAVIFFPFFFLTILIFFAAKFAGWQKENADIAKKIIKIAVFYLTTFAGSLLIFSIFMPAVFVRSRLFFNYTIGYSFMKYLVPFIILGELLILGDAFFLKSRTAKKIIGWLLPHLKFIQTITPLVLFVFFLLALVNWNANQFILNPQNIINHRSAEEQFLKSASIYVRIFYQFYPFVFSLTPLVIFSLLFVWIKFSLKKISQTFIALILSLFILVYFAALVAEGLPATVRYIIILYPLASILAAFGIGEFFSLKKFENMGKIWISLAIILMSCASLWLIKPFYFNYAADLLPKKYTIASAWGYGGFEAAQYLNSLAGSENSYVWTDYYGFRHFFVGKSTMDYILKEKVNDLDYYILTAKGRIKYEYWCCNRGDRNACKNKYIPAEKHYNADNPVWSLYIDNRPDNYVKIYKGELR